MPHNLLIVPFAPWHIEALDLRKEQKVVTDYYKELCGSTEAYGNLFLSHAPIVDREPLAYTALLDGKIIACSGIYTVSPHIGEAWALISNTFVKSHKAVKIEVIKAIKEGLEKSGFKRVQANTEVDFKIGQRFLEGLGFEKEGIAKSYSPDGRDSVMYGRINER